MGLACFHWEVSLPQPWPGMALKAKANQGEGRIFSLSRWVFWPAWEEGEEKGRLRKVLGRNGQLTVWYAGNRKFSVEGSCQLVLYLGKVMSAIKFTSSVL